MNNVLDRLIHDLGALVQEWDDGNKEQIIYQIADKANKINIEGRIALKLSPFSGEKEAKDEAING